MPKYNDDILAVENTNGRYYKITLLLHSRPDNSEDYVEYLNKVTEVFVTKYRCKFVRIEDIHFNQFSESIILFFIVKEWKHPEKHQPSNRFIQ